MRTAAATISGTTRWSGRRRGGAGRRDDRGDAPHHAPDADDIALVDSRTQLTGLSAHL